MSGIPAPSLPLATCPFGGRSFATLELQYEPGSRSLWMYYREDGTRHFSMEMLDDIAQVRDMVVDLHLAHAERDPPVRYFVMASRMPGVFNLGGDLSMFAEAVRTDDRERLRGYAHACVDLVHGLTTAFGLRMVTVSVVNGRALGGGLEAALAEDFIIASPTAQMGVPEVAFNSFPGMGAISLLSRRLGAARAERLISSGAVFSGAEMYDFGVVDILAPDEDAEGFARTWLGEDEARFDRRYSLACARRTLFPVSRDELMRITDMWVDCSCSVSANDVRHMERLAAAQRRILG